MIANCKFYFDLLFYYNWVTGALEAYLTVLLVEVSTSKQICFYSNSFNKDNGIAFEQDPESIKALRRRLLSNFIPT